MERSNVTVFNTGETITIINEDTSFKDETLVLTEETTLVLEEGGYISAPTNTDWPAIRLTIGSTFKGTGGYVNGSYATPNYELGEGGEAIHLLNGQSSADTASYAEFYDGVYVIGGDAPDGIGGNALHVHGIGTEAVIYGGSFVGGKGLEGDGLSIWVLNSGKVHVRGGSFLGEVKVEGDAMMFLYGCFEKNGTSVTGMFADEKELDIVVRTRSGGEVVLVSVSEQQCDTAPSTSPTNFPTISPQPTITPPNDGRRLSLARGFSVALVLMETVTAFL